MPLPIREKLRNAGLRAQGVDIQVQAFADQKPARSDSWLMRSIRPFERTRTLVSRG